MAHLYSVLTFNGTKFCKRLGDHLVQDVSNDLILQEFAGFAGFCEGVRHLAESRVLLQEECKEQP